MDYGEGTGLDGRAFGREGKRADEHEEEEEEQDQRGPKVPRVYPDELPKSFDHDGKKLVAREGYATLTGMSRRYSCCKWKTKGCPFVAKLCYDYTTQQTASTFTGEHTCGVDVPETHEAQVHIVDLKDAMKARVQEVAVTTGVRNAAMTVAREVRDEFVERYQGYSTQMLMLEQLQQYVYEARSQEYGEWRSAIWKYPILGTGDRDDANFTQFDLTINHEGTPLHAVGFAHPSLIYECRSGPMHVFIDCTFGKVVPKEFSQVFILMVFHPQTDLFLPVWWVALDTKTEFMYGQVLNQVQRRTMRDSHDTRGALIPISLTMDFEDALGNAAQTELRRADGVNIDMRKCLFHFKQSLSRKLKDLGVHAVTRHKLMGLVNTLTVIPIADILPYGIPWLRSQIEEASQQDQHNAFWVYFKNEWMRDNASGPRNWNVNDFLTDPSKVNDLINRTNNALERLNREFKAKFEGTMKPTMLRFIEVIKNLSNYYVQEIEYIKRGARRAPRHEPNVPPADASYVAYRAGR